MHITDIRACISVLAASRPAIWPSDQRRRRHRVPSRPLTMQRRQAGPPMFASNRRRPPRLRSSPRGRQRTSARVAPNHRPARRRRAVRKPPTDSPFRPSASSRRTSRAPAAIGRALYASKKRQDAGRSEAFQRSTSRAGDDGRPVPVESQLEARRRTVQAVRRLPLILLLIALYYPILEGLEGGTTSWPGLWSCNKTTFDLHLIGCIFACRIGSRRRRANPLC